MSEHTHDSSITGADSDDETHLHAEENSSLYSESHQGHSGSEHSYSEHSEHSEHSHTGTSVYSDHSGSHHSSSVHSGHSHHSSQHSQYSDSHSHASHSSHHSSQNSHGSRNSHLSHSSNLSKTRRKQSHASHTSQRSRKSKPRRSLNQQVSQPEDGKSYGSNSSCRTYDSVKERDALDSGSEKSYSLKSEESEHQSLRSHESIREEGEEDEVGESQVDSDETLKNDEEEEDEGGGDSRGEEDEDADGVEKDEDGEEDENGDEDGDGEGGEDEEGEDEEAVDDWTYYDGGAKCFTPTRWGELYPICDEGEMQSPIDIVHKKTTYVPDLDPIQCVYKDVDLCKLVNTGKNLLIETEKDPSYSMAFGGPLNSEGDWRLLEIIFHGQGLRNFGTKTSMIFFICKIFSNFAFHWGTNKFDGSEHKIDGLQYTGEIQYVHYNIAKYETYEDALGQEDGVAIISRFFKCPPKGDNSSRAVNLDRFTYDLLERCISDFEGVSYARSLKFKSLQNLSLWLINKEEQEAWVPLVIPKPLAIFPKKLHYTYYYYTGSLTQPPCEENVLWIILQGL